MALDYKIIGNRIQTRRREKGVTQEQMAEALDFSVGFVSQVERGISKLSLDSLDAVAEYLDCPHSALLDNSNTNHHAYCQTEFNSMYELLTPKDQRLFYYMLEVYMHNRNSDKDSIH